MRTEISSIKSVKSLKSIFAALFDAYVEIAGEKHAHHHDGMFTDGCEFKTGGLRFWKERCISVAECIITKKSRVSHFIPPSEETLSWGGFLGGERISYTNENAKAVAIEDLKKIISSIKH